MRKKRPNPGSLPAEERRLRSRLHQLLGAAEGFLHGSLIEMARRCGNPRCRCASDDDKKHRSLYLGQTRGGKTTMQYVPKDQEETVRRWSADFQEAAALLEGLSGQGRLRLEAAKVKKKRAAKVKKTKGKPRKKTTRTPPS